MAPDTDDPNAEQRARWDGPSGDTWTEYADRFERGYADYDAAFLAAVAAGPTDRVLDVGSGPGALALALGRRAAAVHGIDVSSRLVDLARRRAAGTGGVTFAVGDAQTEPFVPSSYDLVVSHFGSMFFADPVAAFANLHTALRPAGRLVLLTWRAPEHNPWQVEVLTALHPDRDPPIPPTDGPSPFGLSDASRVRAVLTGAGFVDVDLTALTGRHWWGDDPDDALTLVRAHHAPILDAYDDDTRRRALARTRDVFAAHRTDAGVLVDSATWLVTARRP